MACSSQPQIVSNKLSQNQIIILINTNSNPFWRKLFTSLSFNAQNTANITLWMIYTLYERHFAVGSTQNPRAPITLCQKGTKPGLFGPRLATILWSTNQFVTTSCTLLCSASTISVMVKIYSLR